MQKATKVNVRKLNKSKGDHFISMYVPLHAGPENQQRDAITLKQALTELRKKLSKTKDIRYDQAIARIENAANEMMLKRVDGTACFFDNFDTLTTLHTPSELPTQVYVNGRPVTDELAGTLSHNPTYLVLALSQQAVHLYKCTKTAIRETGKVSDNIEPMLEELHIDELNATINTHPTGMGGSKGAHGFHGYGSLHDQRKKLIEQYFRKIDAKIYPILKKNNLPVILAGVDFLLPIYKKVSKYKNIAKVEIHGNMDRIQRKKLLELVQPLV